MAFWNREKKKKVLLVEDDKLLSRVLSERLSIEKFEVINVMDGAEAFDTAKKNKPDIILLDLILPGLDGFEILKQLKEDSTTEKIPVAVVSNLDSVSDVKSVKVLGAEEYFIKANVRMDEIVKFVKKRVG